MAAIEALNALKQPCEVDLYTDSSYVKDGIGGWIEGWKRNGWKTAAKKPVKNAELWQALDAARKRHKVVWHWVKGHAGHAENERADELARLGMAPFKPQSHIAKPEADATPDPETPLLPSRRAGPHLEGCAPLIRLPPPSPRKNGEKSDFIDDFANCNVSVGTGIWQQTSPRLTGKVPAGG